MMQESRQLRNAITVRSRNEPRALLCRCAQHLINRCISSVSLRYRPPVYNALPEVGDLLFVVIQRLVLSVGLGLLASGIGVALFVLRS